MMQRYTKAVAGQLQNLANGLELPDLFQDPEAV